MTRLPLIRVIVAKLCGVMYRDTKTRDIQHNRCQKQEREQNMQQTPGTKEINHATDAKNETRALRFVRSSQAAPNFGILSKSLK